MSADEFVDILHHVAPLAQAGRIRVLDQQDMEAFFRGLWNNFPVYGSKIDFRGLQGLMDEETDRVLEGRMEDFTEFFDKAVKDNKLTGDILFSPDGMEDCILAGDIAAIRETMPGLFTYGQHYYFSNPDYAWCINLTMEGDMRFGFAPPKGSVNNNRGGGA